MTAEKAQTVSLECGHTRSLAVGVIRALDAGHFDTTWCDHADCECHRRVLQRSTHVVYRIGSEFSYQETPCFCPARQSHSVLDTLVIRPGERT